MYSKYRAEPQREHLHLPIVHHFINHFMASVLTLALERVHHVQRSHRLAASVLGVGDGVADDVLEEHLQHTTSLLVDEARDALHTATASQTADGGLGDALDVVAKDLAAEDTNCQLAAECLFICEFALTGGAWRRPCPDPCLPCHDPTFCMMIS